MTYRSDVDAGGEMRCSLYLGAVKAVENLSDICSKSGEDLGCVASHAHQTD